MIAQSTFVLRTWYFPRQWSFEMNLVDCARKRDWKTRLTTQIDVICWLSGKFATMGLHGLKRIGAFRFPCTTITARDMHFININAFVITCTFCHLGS
jgi:hypothetical protein